ncbi:MAG TPA: PPOX class F420-dependent oxidoreductase [Anaerolineales bacterium]|nr:PPOX class F420-dependent oxidoreductase [Anaerolineales bacterium]
MDIQQAQEFISKNHRAVMMTYKKDGSPQLSPILIGLDAEGYGIISSRETAYKVKNLRRDARASVCVFNDKFYGRWIQLDGRAEIISMPVALEPLVDYYKRVVGEHPNWEEYREAMGKEKRVLVRIKIEQAGPTVSG